MTTVSVTDYGADPTGATDSITAINDAMAALVAASPTGGELFFPAGTYMISDTIHVGDGVMVSTKVAAASAGINLTSLVGGTTANITVGSGLTIPDASGMAGFWLSANGRYEIVMSFTGYSGGVLQNCAYVESFGAGPPVTTVTSTNDLVTWGTVSTSHGILLVGEGLPGSTGYTADALIQNSTTIIASPEFPANAALIYIKGPMMGWGVSKDPP